MPIQPFLMTKFLILYDFESHIIPETHLITFDRKVMFLVILVWLCEDFKIIILSNIYTHIHDDNRTHGRSLIVPPG